MELLMIRFKTSLDIKNLDLDITNFLLNQLPLCLQNICSNRTASTPGLQWTVSQWNRSIHTNQIHESRYRKIYCFKLPL